MPRAVFKLLWDYLESGRPIAAYVKNMAADGCYYWVVATVVPVTGGYLSVRFKPAAPLFEIIRTVYAELRQIEIQHEARGGSGKKDGMAASTARLGEILVASGFASYDDFMAAMLKAESQVRAGGRATLPFRRSAPRADEGGLPGILNACHTVERFLDGVFGQLEAFTRLDRLLKTQSDLVLAFAEHINLTSHNAVAAAHHLQSEGATLTVIAHAMGAHASDSVKSITELRGEINRTGQSLTDVSVRTCIARTQVEMAIAFAHELQQGGQNAEGVGDVGASLRLLAECLDAGATHAMTALRDLASRLNQLSDRLSGMQDALRSLEMVQVAARIESARIGRASLFGSLFADVAERVSTARSDVTTFVDAIHDTRADVLASAAAESDVRGALSRLARASADIARRPSSPAERVA